MPNLSPNQRWALTPPFHPYLERRLFSVALAVEPKRFPFQLGSTLLYVVRTFLFKKAIR